MKTMFLFLCLLIGAKLSAQETPKTVEIVNNENVKPAEPASEPTKRKKISVHVDQPVITEPIITVANQMEYIGKGYYMNKFDADKMQRIVYVFRDGLFYPSFKIANGKYFRRF